MTTSIKAVGGRGSDGMVGKFKSLINVVNRNRPKMLIGLNQKVHSGLTHFVFGLHGQNAVGG